MGLAEREAEMQELETSRPGRSRDLFGVQLEVIASKILFASLTFNQKFLRSKIIFTQIPIFFLKFSLSKVFTIPTLYFFSFSRLPGSLLSKRKSRKHHENHAETLEFDMISPWKFPLKIFCSSNATRSPI